jgi:CheY-like chemotaxis protein
VKGFSVQSDQTIFTDVAESEVTADAGEAVPNVRTILAVDDDPIILMNTAALLQDLGHQVFEASSGREALDQLARCPEIDLLITDHAMPGMTGSELIDAARALRPELSVILATGFSGEDVVPGSGLTRLNKPYSFAELEAAVGQADC